MTVLERISDPSFEKGAEIGSEAIRPFFGDSPYKMMEMTDST